MDKLLTLARGNSHETQIIRASVGKRIGDAVMDPEARVTLIKKITLWRAYTGSTKVDSEGKQITIEANYLIENYAEMTLDELELCVKLYSTQQLDLKPRDYINFCPTFMSEVIAAFNQYKRKHVESIREKFDKEPPPQAPAPSAAERAEVMRSIIRDVHTQIEGGQMFIFMLTDVYRYLWKTRQLTIPDAMIQAARQYAFDKAKILDDQQANEGRESFRQHLQTRERSMRLFAVEYCLKEFFKTNPVEKVIDRVNEKHFVVTETEK